MSTTKKTYSIDGMTCAGCEFALERAVSQLEGIVSVKGDYAKNELCVEYESPCTEESIKAAVSGAGYKVADKTGKAFTAVCILVIIIGLYIIARQFGLSELFQKFPTVSEQNVGYGVLFLIGLLTSVHCVAMCGGINLTQSVTGEGRPVKRSLLYNLGRLTGYTVVGGVLGLIGEAASITLKVRGIIGIAAGIFMIITAVNMLGGFSFLRRLTPKVPKGAAKLFARARKLGPFPVGVVNSLMPCGPLQSMQLYAVACGSFLAGALSMFFFCLGTIPLVFVFGAVAGTIKHKWKSVMMSVSAVLVALLGLSMLSNNLALTGIKLPSLSKTVDVSGEQSAYSVLKGDKQYVETELKTGSFGDIVIQKGVPVVWTIKAEEGSINGCNNKVIISEYSVEKELEAGENVITFTPEESGEYTITCWMGMIKNTITVE